MQIELRLAWERIQNSLTVGNPMTVRKFSERVPIDCMIHLFLEHVVSNNISML